MRKTLIRLLGGYTEKGLVTVKPSEMTSSTVNRNFTNVIVEVKAGNLDVKISAWDELMVTNILNKIFENMAQMPQEENPLVQ